MTGILKAILFLIPAFALSIFAAFFARVRLEQWKPPSESTWNALLVSLLTLAAFGATMWLSGRLVSWWLKRRTQENEK